MKHRSERARASRRAAHRRAYARKHPVRKYIFDGMNKNELWALVLEKYGPRCNCCGETTLLFLQLDHVNNDGYLDKDGNGKRIRKQGQLRKVIRQNFPPRYQILCANCNHGKERNGGICPHVEIAADPLAHRRTVSNGVFHSENDLPLFSHA